MWYVYSFCIIWGVLNLIDWLVYTVKKAPKSATFHPHTLKFWLSGLGCLVYILGRCLPILLGL